MTPKRRQRLAATGFVLFGTSVTLALVLLALGENVNLFYEPQKVVGGVAPVGRDIRAGGMVAEGSVVHDAEGLGVRFVLTDYQGHDFEVRYNGLLPGLFREGQGILVNGRLNASGVFEADEVLAKHDESYMPPELEGIAKPP